MNIQAIIITIAILIIIGFVIYIIAKLVSQKKLEPKIIEMITVAESTLNENSGAEKFEFVFDRIYNTFAPKIVRILFSAEEVRKIIQYTFDKVKIALDYRGE